MRAPGTVQLLDRRVLAFQLLDERLLGRLLGRRGQGGQGQRGFVAPAQLVVDKIAQAPRVAYRGTLFLGHSLLETFAKSGIERVGELAPVARAPFDRLALAADRRHIGRLAQPVDGRVGPVGDCIQAPTPQTPVRDLGKLLRPIVAVLAQQVGLHQGVRLVRFLLIVSVRRPVAFAVELGKRLACGGQLGEPVFPIGDRRGGAAGTHAVDAVRPEQAALGIDQPPLSLMLLRAEEPGRFELRAGQPAAVLIPFGGAGMLCQVGGLFLTPLGQIAVAVDLARPLLVHVLPIAVDHREQPRKIGRQRNRGRAAGADIRHFEEMIGIGFGDEDPQLADAGRIEQAIARDAAGIAPHPK